MREPMANPLTEPKKPLGRLPFVLAALAFIPSLGVLLGIPSIVWGFIERSRGGLKVAAIAATGVALNIIGYSILFYVGFVKKGGFGEARRGLAVMQLRQAVLEVEYWHTQNGHYPDSLAQLASKADSGRTLSLLDPTMMTFGRKGPAFFFYQLASDKSHYWLRSVGPDGQPFTADDILPSLPDSERTKTGLLIAPP